MKNPFLYGKEVGEEYFCNRTKEIKELLGDIESSQNVIIFSPRRFGKTSLINKVLQKTQEGKILTVYMDLYSVLTEEQLAETYASAVVKALVGKLKAALREVVGLFKNIRPKLTLDENGKPVYGIDIINKRETLPLLEDVLESVNKYVTKKKKKAVVVLDEFQQIGQFKTDRAERIMRSVFQKHKDISYIFMGSKKHLISDMFNNPNRPFYRSAKPFPLSKIDESALSHFIKNRFESTGKNIDDAFIARIISICECHPYYIQYFCNIVWEKARDKKRVDEGDLKESLELLLLRESHAYEATWDMLTFNQKQVLLALSQENTEEDQKLFSSKLLEKYSLNYGSSIRRTLESLINKDLIDKERGNYAIVDVIFKKWLSKLNKE